MWASILEKRLMTLQEVEIRFKLRTKTGIPKTDTKRESVTGFYLHTARNIIDFVPPGREQSLALTKLEESWLHSLTACERAS